MTEDQKGIQQACIEWMVQNKDGLTHAVSLTLLPHRVVLNENGTAIVKITHIEAKATFRLFMKRLNASLFGNVVKRYGKKLSVIPVLEGQGTNKLLHYHCAIGNVPEGMSIETLKLHIHAAWLKTPFGNQQIDVKLIESAEWFAYMGKEIGIKHADVMDWDNVVIPSAPTSLT